ncbi:hypothetical protein J6590_043209 [Homalodisca vitripennis]|nr:hypothetical protein J6590_043209 [Homalodisca vitripennis]
MVTNSLRSLISSNGSYGSNGVLSCTSAWSLLRPWPRIAAPEDKAQGSFASLSRCKLWYHNNSMQGILQLASPPCWISKIICLAVQPSVLDHQNHLSRSPGINLASQQFDASHTTASQPSVLDYQNHLSRSPALRAGSAKSFVSQSRYKLSITTIQCKDCIESVLRLLV